MKISNYLLLLCGIWILNFLLLYLSPGDVTQRYWGPKIDRSRMKILQEARGLQRPFWAQFGFWTRKLLSGDFGYSWTQHRPVREIFSQAVPATFRLTAPALLLNFIFGCSLGIFAATFAHRSSGQAINFFNLFIYAMPLFWLAIGAIYLFALKLRWFPVSGMQSIFLPEQDAWHTGWDRLKHLVLPVTVLGLASGAATFRYVRNQMIEILTKDYLLMARAKGLSRWQVVFKHGFRNALLPVVTQMGLYFPMLLSGVFVIEIIFAWPGMGRVMYQAVLARDYPVILSTNFFAACLVLVGNLISDTLYTVIDPRVKWR